MFNIGLPVQCARVQGQKIWRL